ncbi:polysaccharide biosynthesis C-terminal domain-containing protein, partial [Gammaproteobacteria bacterium]|nr:polysaccharide biosynthesis C-terminal domain-containing protein [Gammaproteobacteria bacterium]
DEFKETLDWGLRCILLIGLPACLALTALAEPMVITLYQRGEFGVESVLPTSRALQAYSLGLLAFMAIKVLASAYFSRQDTKTPVRYGIIAMISNMVMNLLLILPLAHIGLALATAFSSWVNAGLLLFGLIKLKLFSFHRKFFFMSLQIILANLLMLAFIMGFNTAADQWIEWNTLTRVGNLAFLCIGGGFCYCLGLLIVGIRPSNFRH